MVVNFDFKNGFQGWMAGFSDYNPSNIDIYNFKFELRKLPKSAGDENSLFMSSMNRSDDVFMFFKREVGGLKPSKSYDAKFRLGFASKYRSRLGIGGDEARDVFVKVCKSATEPSSIMQEGILRLNIDMGAQKNAGRDSVVLGSIEKPNDSSDQYVKIELSSAKALRFDANENGSIWLLFGTDSGYEGETELYYTHFYAEFVEAK